MLNTCLMMMTVDFLETSGVLRGYPSDPSSPLALYPAGGLNQTTPDSPLWTQLAFTKTHQALWRQLVFQPSPSLCPVPSGGLVKRTPKQRNVCLYFNLNTFFWELNRPVLRNVSASNVQVVTDICLLMSKMNDLLEGRQSLT